MVDVRKVMEELASGKSLQKLEKELGQPLQVLVQSQFFQEELSEMRKRKEWSLR